METSEELARPRSLREVMQKLAGHKPELTSNEAEPTVDPIEPSSTEQLLGRLLVKDRRITRSQLEEALEIQRVTRPHKLIGQVLMERGSLSQAELRSILDVYRKRSPLGKILVKSKAISPEQLTAALDEQKKTGLRLGEVLVRLNYVSEETLRQALSTHLSIPFVDLNTYALDQRLTRLINRNYAKKHLVVPVCMDGSAITLAMEDPTNVTVAEEVRSFTGRTVNVVTSTHQALQRAFWRLYEGGEPEQDATSKMEMIGDVPHETGLAEGSTAAKHADAILRDLMAAALEHRASDIHLETVDSRMQARFRVDGELRVLPLTSLNEALGKNGRPLVSRIKILASLDIAEKRRPQDGSFRVRVQKNDQLVDADCRVSVLPGYYGENVVVRILDQRNAPTAISQLGFSTPITEQLFQLLRRQAGIILITGPTGSGKSTSLFAALKTLHRPGIKVLTVEDPIEYVCERFTQCEVNERIGNTFSSFLRSFLRHDPEVIMVGEIRDEESAELAFRAAQTGHLVLTTLHTNNAVTTIQRLLDLGVDRNVITSSLLGIMGQRLVRKTCEQCRTEHEPSETILKELFAGSVPGVRWYRGAGCQRCNFTGYSGRIPVGELWVPSDNDILLINKNAPFDEVIASARASTVSMAEDVWDRLRAGETNIEEVVRALPYTNLYKFRESSFLG